jgi:hypothetical protein
MEKEKAPRKPRKKATAKKAVKRDWSIIPIWAKSDDGIGIKKINMPANLDKAFVQRFGLMTIPNEAELLGWIQLHSA